MTREEALDATLVECLGEFERLKDHVANHPERVDAINRLLAKAKAIEMPDEPTKPTGVLHKLFGDRRNEERDPGEHEQRVAEELGLADQ